MLQISLLQVRLLIHQDHQLNLRHCLFQQLLNKRRLYKTPHIDICQVVNLATALQKLKKAGAWIFGAVKDEAAQSIYKTDFKLPACVVVGSEGQGIRPLVRQQCDVLISIPMEGSLDSLNSSVAAGVIMFEMLRQRIV